MGVCITATNSSIEFKTSYGMFHRLRCNIAKAIDEEFAVLYHKATAFVYEADGIEAERELNNYLTKNYDYISHVDEVLNFLFQSDVEGKVNYKTCRKILELIDHINFENENFQYVSNRTSENDYEVFKKFLKECIKYHRDMRWY